MRILRWLESGMVYFAIAAALVSGLAASYGRELELGRMPNSNWWLRRMLLLPLLAISATAATNAFHLSTSSAAFSAAMLSLGGYDVIRLIEARWLRRIAAVADVASLTETHENADGLPLRK